MKIIITGHTSGIGSSLFEEFQRRGHDVVGISRSNGYDISDEKVQESIVELSRDADIFVNNAYQRFHQVDLFTKIWRSWRNHPKKIINLGSLVSTIKYGGPEDQKDIIWRSVYAADKASLDMVSQWAWLDREAKCEVMLVKPGMVDTPSIKNYRVGHPKIDPDELAKYIVDSALDHSFTVRELAIANYRKKKMRKLFYMGLESYEARYTLQLTEWNRRVFERRGLNVIYVPGSTIDNTKSISVGQVLDAHGRSYFGMSQMMNLVQMMRNGEINDEDVIYFEDMFQPGIESLPYIMDQIPVSQRPQVWVRCLAQAIDPDDFVHVWGMSKWMSTYEKMVNCFVTGVLATNEEMVAHMKIAGWEAPIYNISGLAFGKQEVIDRIGGRDKIKPFPDRQMRVVFAARFDQEKQPDFFMDLVEKIQEDHPNVKFAVLQGGHLRSNNPRYIERARSLQAQGKLDIYENLKKNEYYEIVNDSRVLFNCALQDWVSNTVSEADALGCNVLYPAYRSFPETFANDPNRMYVPWSIDDAALKLYELLKEPHHNMGLISDWNDGTIDRIVDIITGSGEQWNRSGNRYRDHVAPAKYSVARIEC